jgi:hypothetical protein
MPTNSQNREEDICISEIESNPTTYQGSFNSSTIEFISKAVQAQPSAILTNMIQEITKSSSVEVEIMTRTKWKRYLQEDEPPAKKVNITNEFSDLNDDSTVSLGRFRRTFKSSTCYIY